MKKILVLLLVAMLLAPAAAMAVDKVWLSVPIEAANGEGISTLSNKVSLHWIGNDLQYAVMTGHTSGSKIYGSTSQDTKIFSSVSDPVVVAVPDASDSTAFDGWKPL
jgi:hypothetical protein